MTRFRYTLLLIFVLSASGWAVFESSNTYSETVNVYFFVAPSMLSDGSSSATKILELKKFLAETAGGYTELSESEGGWVNDQGDIETEINHTFLVSSTQDLSEQLRTYLAENFSQTYPYVLKWQAEMPQGAVSSIPLWKMNG
jgi:hypothetical protein